MNERNNTGQKVVGLKPRERNAHSPFGQFIPDEELLQATSRIKKQRDVIMERLERMREAKERVSSSVFEKVRRDYSLQLETVTELLNEKKHVLKDQIKRLYVSREKLSFEINRHKEVLEEAEFRYFLGEFTQTQYQEVENFETREIEKLESDLSHITQWLKTHEELFDAGDFERRSPATAQQPAAPFASREPPPRPPARSAATPPRQQPPSSTESPAPPRMSSPIAKDPVVSREDRVTTQPRLAEPAASAGTGVDDADLERLLEDTGAPEPAEGTEANIAAMLDAAATPPPPVAGPHPAPKPPNIHSPAVQRLEKTEVAVKSAAGEDDADLEALLDAVEDDEGETNAAAKALDALDLPEPSEDDYFRGEKPDESFTIPRPAAAEEESVTASRPPMDDPNRRAIVPDASKPVSRDDSISNILNSIRLDGEEARQEAVPTPDAVAAVKACRLVLTHGELDQKEYPLGDNTSIGRSPSNDIVLKEPKVSRQHAAVNKYNEHYIVIDLKSANGVFVNGAKVDECVLHPGDELSIGGYKFHFEEA